MMTNIFLFLFQISNDKMNEKPVSLKKVLKKSKEKTNINCILHFSSVNSTDDIGQLTELTWKKIKQIYYERKTKAKCYD